MDRRPILLLTDDAMDAHESPGHPERPDRRAAVAEGVRDATGEELVEPPCDPAGDDVISRIHEPGLVAQLNRVDAAGGGWLDPDTYLVRGSMRAARLAAGATVQGALAVARGEAGVAFAVVRPPGHHASATRPSGFCLLNNVAIAVAGLRAANLARRVAIIDWDVHHGDGTQAIFDRDESLCYASTHQQPLYPGTGDPGEQGIGDARGTKHNRPLRPGDGDDAFADAWLGDLLPAIEAFRPEAVLVSAGYDAHPADPLANLRVTENGYRSVATALGEVVARLGLPGVALTLEGGYELAALRASARSTVEGLVHGMARA